MLKLSKATVSFLCTAFFWGMLMAGLADKAALATEKTGAGAKVSDQDISDAYLYLLGRLLVLPAEQNYNLTIRLYGPSKDLVDGSYFPPPLVKVE